MCDVLCGSRYRSDMGTAFCLIPLADFEHDATD